MWREFDDKFQLPWHPPIQGPLSPLAQSSLPTHWNPKVAFHMHFCLNVACRVERTAATTYVLSIVHTLVSLYWAKVLSPCSRCILAWTNGLIVYRIYMYIPYILLNAYQGLEDKKSGLSECLALQDHTWHGDSLRHGSGEMWRASWDRGLPERTCNFKIHKR